MTHQTQTFTICDPRDYDGDCFEVAERAVLQAAAIHTLYQQALQDAFVMSRNAEMERQLAGGSDPSAAKYESGPHGQRFERLAEEAKLTSARLKVLTKAAAFNPKGRLDG